MQTEDDNVTWNLMINNQIMEKLYKLASGSIQNWKLLFILRKHIVFKWITNKEEDELKAKH